MVGILTQANIGHHDKVRVGILDGPDSLLDDSIVREVLLAYRIFFIRDAE